MSQEISCTTKITGLFDGIKKWFCSIKSDEFSSNIGDTIDEQEENLFNFLLSLRKLGEYRRDVQMKILYPIHYEGSINMLHDFVYKIKDKKQLYKVLEEEELSEEEGRWTTFKRIFIPPIVSDQDSFSLNIVERELPDEKGVLKKVFYVDQGSTKVDPIITTIESLKNKISLIFTKNNELVRIPASLGFNFIPFDYEVIEDDKKVERKEEVNTEVGGHQNLLIFNKIDEKTIEVLRYEPHGNKTFITTKEKTFRNITADDVINNFLKENLETVDKSGKNNFVFKYISPREWLPENHSQGVEEEGDHVSEDEVGLCQIWCSLILYICVMYDKVELDDIIPILGSVYSYRKELSDIEVTGLKASYQESNMAHDLIKGFSIYISENMNKEGIEYFDIPKNKSLSEKMSKLRREFSEEAMQHYTPETNFPKSSSPKKTKLKRKYATTTAGLELAEKLLKIKK